MYANALDSLLGGSGGASDKKEEPEAKEKKKFRKDASVSFHLSLFGHKIKLEEVFRGYSGLISLAWNLPSKQTSLFSLNHMLDNKQKQVRLSNGMIVHVESLGGFSVDLSGRGEVSFWSMYAKTNAKLRLFMRYFYIL